MLTSAIRELEPDASRFTEPLAVCGTDLGAVYGDVARGLVHVHHLRPLSEIAGEYEVDPVHDLRPVCPNCHAVIHIGGENRRLEEVKQMLLLRSQA